jgi:amino acid transporter
MKKQHKKLKMSLKNFIVYGFSYIVGVTFLSQIAIYAQNSKDESGNQIKNTGIGMYIILIFAIAGLMAYVVARAFGRLSTIYKADQNGGAYIFARATLGKFVGILVMVINYIILPIYIVYQIDTLIKVSFSSEFSSTDPLNNP